MDTIRRIMLAALSGNTYGVMEMIDGEPELLFAREQQSGATVLHCAAMNANIEVVRLLLELGADVNARCDGQFGCTPLHVATNAGGADLILLLVRYGADIEARDRVHNATPAQWAKLYGNEEAAETLEGVWSFKNQGLLIGRAAISNKPAPRFQSSDSYRAISRLVWTWGAPN